MNEENKISPGGNAQNVPKIGDGEGETPLAKQPVEKVDMRTMASDIASLQETGGGIPRSYTPGSHPQNGGNRAKQPGITPPPIPPGASKAPESVFPESMPPATPKKKKGKAFGWILGIILIVGIAAVAYFFILPIIGGNNSAPEISKNENTAPAPIGEENEGQPSPAAEENISEESADENTNLEPENQTVPLPSGQTLDVHVSLLKNPADLVFDVKLSSFTLEDMKSKIEFMTTSIPVFKEIVFKTEENKPISFGYAASRFFPSFFTPDMIEKFQNDGTFFSYTNTEGTWLGLIAKLKDGVEAGPVQDSMVTLQQSPDLKNIFLVDPGNQGAWKDGAVAEKPTSLVDFSRNGATLSYTWFDRYLLIGTNLDGSNEAAKRLGY